MHAHDHTERFVRIACILVVLQVIFGTAVTTGALMLGNLLVAVLGFLIIISAATSAVLLWWVHRLDDSIDRITEQRDGQHRFENARERAAVAENVYKKPHSVPRPSGSGLSATTGQRPTGSARIERNASHAPLENRPLEPERPLMVNLAAFGPGDPSPITAATLGRSTFPRLLRTMDDQPPARAAHGMKARCIESPCETFVPEAADGNDPSSPAIRMAVSPNDACDVADATTTAGEAAVRNLLRTWTSARRDSDLAACRGIYATLVNLVGPARVMTMTGELERLIEQTEQSLRHQFSACIQRRDYAGALDVGERIRTLLFDRPVAQAFERIEPLLQRAMKPQEDQEADPYTTAQGT